MLLVLGSPNLRFRRSSFLRAKMDSSSSSSLKSSSPPKSIRLKPIDASPVTFAEFGQVVSASADGALFGPDDAQLDLQRGVPRFYIMHLQDRKLKFRTITHHASVTQCLGCVGGEEWFLGVAKASILDENKTSDDNKDNRAVLSASGHYYTPPHPDDVRVFRIAGAKFLKINIGTWHAGPLFKSKAMDFYNLELSNTNEVDHTTHDFAKEDGVVFVIED